MTKKEFVAIFEKYDDDVDIQFYDLNSDTWITPKSIEQTIEDNSLVVNLDA